VLSKETLERSIEEVAETVRVRVEDVNAARLRLGEAQRELRLLTELAELRGVDLSAANLALVELTGEPEPNGEGSTRRAPSVSKSALLNAVVETLEERGEPMQIQDLMAAVREREVKIPGKGVQANLIAYISRDPRVVRPRRGFYGLAEWGLKDTTPKRRRRKGGRR
jgi:hypothetical protein